MTKKKFVPGRGYTKEDWDEVGDNPPWTAEDLAKARPFAEVFPDLAASIRRDREAKDQKANKLVSLQLSGEVIEAYKAKGADWEARIDADLRKLNNIK